MSTVGLVLIPVFTAVLGYVTNWTGVIMLFHPVHFRGARVPGLKRLVEHLPRKIQEIPGFMQGGVGWQGIIPSRAAKMGSIAVDKGISKLGTPSEFYRELEPEKIAEHIIATARPDLRAAVETVVEREHPQFWRDLPPPLRERLHERVQEQLPDIVHAVTDEIGENIDQLLDVKMMVIRHVEAHPEVANRIFGTVGERELKLIIYLGFAFGFVLGLPLVGIEWAVGQWWVLLLGSMVIGWVTNWTAIWMIFEPICPHRIGPFTIQGLFLRRQDEVAGVYARLIADEVITLRNIGDELLHGPQSDRTRALVESAMRQAVDRAVGPVRPAVRVAMGSREYDSIREALSLQAVDYTVTPLRDPEFNRERSGAIRELTSEQIRGLPPRDFSELLRSAIRQDEWLLVLHGAVLGLVSGGLHVAIFSG